LTAPRSPPASWPTASGCRTSYSGSNTTKFYAIIVGGRCKGANLLNLDLQARAAMSPRFIFDDNLVGSHWAPFPRFQTKTAAYQLVAADNFSNFDNLGATGAVTFTLPAIANGYSFGFRVRRTRP
jgi:hypothetical protein